MAIDNNSAEDAKLGVSNFLGSLFKLNRVKILYGFMLARILRDS
jgi:hypothetical protein